VVPTLRWQIGTLFRSQYRERRGCKHVTTQAACSTAREHGRSRTTTPLTSKGVSFRGNRSAWGSLTCVGRGRRGGTAGCRGTRAAATAGPCARGPPPRARRIDRLRGASDRAGAESGGVASGGVASGSVDAAALATWSARVNAALACSIVEQSRSSPAQCCCRLSVFDYSYTWWAPVVRAALRARAGPPCYRRPKHVLLLPPHLTCTGFIRHSLLGSLGSSGARGTLRWLVGSVLSRLRGRFCELGRVQAGFRAVHAQRGVAAAVRAPWGSLR
jgi:hypothetical protein